MKRSCWLPRGLAAVGPTPLHMVRLVGLSDHVEITDASIWPPL
jgi:hypothetical protein